MTKDEAVKKWVETLSSVPTDWVKRQLEKEDGFANLPMWGTMFFVDEAIGEELTEKSNYIDDEDDEMYGNRQVVDKDGYGINLYIYEVDGHYLLGINGAGWDFFDGVWDKLYDAVGMMWHDED